MPRIILGVTGSIAAYKAVELLRLLTKAGHEVQCVLTPAATRFVTPLTFQALSGRTVASDLFDPSLWSFSHLELAKWGEAIVIAPATTDTLARLASGRADDLLAALLLATTVPVLLAPAMHDTMWRHPATQANIRQLRQFGYHLVGPVHGPLGRGDVGLGRLADPAAIVRAIDALFKTKSPRRRQSLR
ncbi:MAG: hypothetical protein HYZ73_07115 [Elusimicrobia bacterium]|nr:hypothetical protein [Elusimicrobiota bacterium]